MSEPKGHPKPAGEPMIRASVQRFAHLMEDRLKANDHKGDWETERREWLLMRLMEEVGELVSACREGDPGRIDAEAADVANFAMIISGNARPEMQAEIEIPESQNAIPFPFCKVCTAMGIRSEISIGFSLRARGGCSAFYDEEDRFHLHNSDQMETNYSCPRGHRWMIRSNGTCWCGWSGQQ